MGVKGLTPIIVYCILHDMNTALGEYIREKREALRQNHRRYSLRQVAGHIGVEPSYLSKIERGETSAYLTEKKIRLLAGYLGEDPDVLLALSGKISLDVQEIIRKRPQLFARIIRELGKKQDELILKAFGQFLKQG
jgi:HTH-type transcriptional regulator, competence development regulator